MINNYNEFILENLINESVVFFSEKFRKLIKDIDSPVAKLLSDIENRDLTVSSNYIDISDKDTISFIPDRKAQEILNGNKTVSYTGNGGILSHNLRENGKIFAALGYEPEGEKGYKPETGEKGVIISKMTTETTNRTYLFLQFPNGKCVCNEQRTRFEEDIWTRNRQTIRTGRGIKSLLTAAGQTTTDREIEEFVNKYKSAYDRMNDIFKDFEIVDGDKISFWYDQSNYAMQGRGQLSNSCMSSVPTSYFQIYTQNPEVCRLLILKTEDGAKIKGRALLWNLSSGVSFLDRVYTHSDSDVELFREYAKTKGITYKYNNNSTDSSESILPNGDKVNLKLISVTLKSKTYSNYPYLDTLKYLNTSTGILSNEGDGDSDVITLEDTSGSYVGGGCDSCDGDGRVECSECYGRGTENCSSCDGDGDNECYTCSGSGNLDCSNCVSGDVECGTCSGSGKDGDDNDCTDCSGKGKSTCEECDGSSSIECSDCSGRGRIDCDDCDGDGRQSCDNCSGEGQVNCYECND